MAESAPPRLHWMDGLRILGCVLVCSSHFNEYLIGSSDGGGAVVVSTFLGVNLGGLGVALFFLLSGAALMHVYGGRLDVPDYAKRRFLDIYPQYWVPMPSSSFWRRCGDFPARHLPGRSFSPSSA